MHANVQQFLIMLKNNLAWANHIFFKTCDPFEHFFFLRLFARFCARFALFCARFALALWCKNFTTAQQLSHMFIGQLWCDCKVPTNPYHTLFSSGALLWRTALFEANYLESLSLGDPSCNRKLSPCQHPTRDLSTAEFQTIPCLTSEHWHRTWSLQDTKPQHAATQVHAHCTAVLLLNRQVGESSVFQRANSRFPNPGG